MTLRWPRLSPALLMGIFLFMAWLTNTGPIADMDYGLHLRIGQEISETGRPPRMDTHSYTLPHAFYPDHEWLSQWFFYVLHSRAGDGGMVVIKALLVALVLWLAGSTVPGPLLLRLAVSSTLLWLGFDYAQMRPLLLAWILVALLNHALFKRWPLAAVGLLALWGNLHGSVLLGAVMALLGWCEDFSGDTRPQKWIWPVLFLAAPLANPLGWRVYALFFNIRPHTSFITEWQAYGIHTGGFWFLTGMLGFLLAKNLRTFPLPTWSLIRIFLLAGLGFQSSRHAMLSAILAAPWLVQAYGGWVQKQPVWFHRAGLAAIFIGLGLALGWRLEQGQVGRFFLDKTQIPSAALDFVNRHHASGPVFNDYNFGGYFLWKAWPAHPVFIDGRTEVYQGPVLENYLTISRARPGWETLVKQYKISFFVLRPEREISRRLLAHPDWDLVYFDYNSVIYLRHDLLPEVRRLKIISPYGHRDRKQIGLAMEETLYLLGENPDFFGGYKILAFLFFRQGNRPAALQALRDYLRLHPKGAGDPETRSLLQALRNQAPE